MTFIIISLHFSIVYNAILATKKDFTKTQIITAELHTMVILLSLLYLMWFYGLFGILLWFINACISILIARSIILKPFTQNYLKFDYFILFLSIFFNVFKLF